MADKMRVLVVDDEEGIRASLREILEDEGYGVLDAGNAANARARIATGVDLVLLDIQLGDDSGIDLLREFKAEYPAVPVIMISGHGTVALTAEAFKLGAHEFMEKPLRLIPVRSCVRNALESVRLKRRVAEQERRQLPRPVYRSKAMRDLYAQAARLASLSESVVILGPSGAGKELVAQSLHYDGARRNGPFVATNAASMPVNLAEDELFGHEKGAFTGAQGQRKGCLELASGGTLFLDEIADLAPQIQAKLLRVLETCEVTRLGGIAPVRVNVRIVAATHQDLERLSREGTFRHDLWYRLCAFILKVPPLRERPEDIEPLATMFLERTSAEIDTRKRFSRAAIERLAALPLAGNVRELKHIVTRAAIFSECEEVGAEDIDRVTGGVALTVAASAPGAVSAGGLDSYLSLDYRSARRRFEEDFLRAALARHGHNITATAAALGMAQSNLSRRLKELGLR